jgi:predicted nucleic acid-binding protein
LAKLYVAEAGSDELVTLALGAEELCVSALAEFEFLSAIGRRKHDAELTAKQYEQLRSAFYSDWSEAYVQQPLSDAVFEESRILLGAYRLRTLDALQLASAITVTTVRKVRPQFVTSDRNLADVARREGFETIEFPTEIRMA